MLEKKIIDRLYQKFLSGYGNTFTAIFKNSEVIGVWYQTWGEVLDGLTNEQIGHGLKLILSRDSEYPPSVGEFKAACKALEIKKPDHEISNLKPARLTPERREQINRLSKVFNKDGPWWTPARITTHAQVLLINDQAERFPEAKRFKEACIAAGVITKDGKLANSKGGGSEIFIRPQEAS